MMMYLIIAMAAWYVSREYLLVHVWLGANFISFIGSSIDRLCELTAKATLPYYTVMSGFSFSFSFFPIPHVYYILLRILKK